MSDPRNTDPMYRSRYATTRNNNNVMWGIVAAVAVALAIGWYAYGHSGYGPTVASDATRPVTGMNAPASPVTPPATPSQRP